ncbi:DUF4876 domain-containing protein [Halosquirtibacter xylanolyticus]|uniref:DUF4876 domain-containing protein n=1 Tax=Halosquirtibacter xylanolyticus TaxID=3374599 RepID=UPI003747ABD0|nr:DUF4876 domain-containing protein [Prolixibacteraceae bacterium]
MMYKKLSCIALLASLLIVSCQKDQMLPLSDVEVKMHTPKSFSNDKVKMKTATVTITNVETGSQKIRKIKNLGVPFLKVEDGTYNLQLDGILEVTTADLDKSKVVKEVGVRGMKQNVKVEGGRLTLDLDLYVYNINADLIFSEIYFTGSLNVDGTAYSEDKFFEIYNNSERDLYADDLCIAETEFQTDIVLSDLKVDERDKYTAVSKVYRVGGNGKQFLLKPGESFLIVDRAINHKTINSNSLDLTKANFEWYDISTTDEDTPGVPNMQKMTDTPVEKWSPNDKGQKSFILFRRKAETTDVFMKAAAYSYIYTYTENGVKSEINRDAWRIQNSSIIDAVECSPKGQFNWKTLSSQLDIKYFSLSMDDNNRYGHSIRRKVAFIANERPYLIDSDNSSTDFIESSSPSPGIIEGN